MHEFSLATQIVESVLEFAESQQASEVLKVRLQVGELACVERVQLIFCYNSITRETMLEKSTLEIDPVKALVRCPNCHYYGSPKYWDAALAGNIVPTLQCPACGRAATATQGHECAIESVQFVRSGVSATCDKI